MKKDGNSKNGYHNVKCQVPETEELERTEKRNRKRAHRERERNLLTTLWQKRRKEFALSYINAYYSLYNS